MRTGQPFPVENESRSPSSGEKVPCLQCRLAHVRVFFFPFHRQWEVQEEAELLGLSWRRSASFPNSQLLRNLSLPRTDLLLPPQWGSCQGTSMSGFGAPSSIPVHWVLEIDVLSHLKGGAVHCLLVPPAPLPECSCSPPLAQISPASEAPFLVPPP